MPRTWYPHSGLFATRAAEAFIDRVANNPEWGYQVRGILDENRE